MNHCVTNHCCPSFNLCQADTACHACLTGSGTNCGSNALWVSYLTCLDTYCTTDFCDSGIGYYDGPDPMFACNQCITSGGCCSQLTSCTNLGTNACVACLINVDIQNCGSQAVVNDVTAFNSCIATNCPGECS